MKRIAITGAAGVVGSALRSELLGRGYALRLLDLHAINDCADHEDSAVADICDQAHMTTLLAGLTLSFIWRPAPPTHLGLTRCA